MKLWAADPGKRSVIDSVRGAYANYDVAASEANDAFVWFMRYLETALLGGAEVVTTSAVAIIPSVTSVVCETAFHLGQRSEPAARASSSVVVASLPGAFYRTAVSLSWLGEQSTARARRLAHLLFGPTTPRNDRLEASYRALGFMVAAVVRDGLDTFLAATPVRGHIMDIGRLKAPTKPTQLHPSLGRPYG